MPRTCAGSCAVRSDIILAELTGGDYVLLEGSGHLPIARDPVKINLLLRDFVRRVTRATV